MDHAAAYERLSAYYDSELRDPDRLEVAQHLKCCATCREALQAWRQVAQTLFRAPEPAPSPALTEAFVHRVMARLDVGRPAPAVPSWADLTRWLTPALGAGLAMAAAIMAWPAQGAAVSTEALLLADGWGTSSPTRVLLAEATIRDEEILDLVLEGSR